MTDTNPPQTDNARAPEELTKPGPEHGRLDVFLGKWKMEGDQYESMFGPAARLTAVETYEWLTGGFFLVHRFEGRMNDQEMACIEIIYYDASSHSYSFCSYYNDGRINEWQAREHDGIWTLTGDWQTANMSLMVRCTTEFSNDGSTRTGKWERSTDGSNWETFWDVKATKV